MAFRTSAPHRRSRWLVLLAVVSITTAVFATSALAAPAFTFQQDDQGANDEPGQKDLTAQASAFDGADFYTAWKWDDTAWSGKNTGDACALFDTNSNGLVNYAVCVTVGNSPATQLSTRVYSCGDTRSDRCTNPIVLQGSKAAGDTTWCSIEGATAQFPPPPSGGDLQATCNISLIDADLSTVTGLNNGTLLNSCSYPSQEPNSDPSDCVVTIANVDVTVSTSSTGTIAWQATLSDSATLSPNTATGSVVFKLYSDSSCTTLRWTSDAAPVVSGAASSGTTGGSPAGANVITNLDNPGNGTYYWIATYTPTGAFNGDSSTCGEATTISASVSGSTGN